jgi:hypothetical protein
LERHARKRLELPKDKPAPMIHVVQLRKTVKRTREDGTAQHEPIEWDFQWTVRGHVRQQWYPSLQKHLPVWIHPHIKGPEGKPLRPRTTPIYSVTR